MANALSQIASPSWKAQFMLVTGYNPDDLGIKDEEHAQQVALQMQQMKNVSAGQGRTQGNWGSVGTRNEAIYPTR
jgi:hypothetical protein